MKAGQQREVIHRIAGDGIVEIDKRDDVVRVTKNVPQGQIFVNETTLSELEQGFMFSNCASDPLPLPRREKV